MKTPTNVITQPSSATVNSTETIAMNARKAIFPRSTKVNNPERRRVVAVVVLFAFALLGFFAMSVEAQGERDTDKSPDQTLRSNARVNPSTLAMEMSIPLFAFPGRAGSSLPNSLEYSSKVWQLRKFGPIVNPSGSEGISAVPLFARRTAAGWTSTLAPPRIDWPDDFPYYMDSGCGYDGELWSNIEYPEGCSFSLYYMKRLHVILGDGSTHEFRASDTPVMCGSKTSTCNNPDLTGTYLSVDGTKMRLEVTSGDSTLFLSNGTRVIFPGIGLFATSMIDVHGNVQTYNSTNKEWTDTLGRTLPNPLPANLGYSQDQTVGDQVIELPGLGSETQETTLSWRYLKHPSSSDPDDSGLGDPEEDLAYPTNFFCVGSTWSEITGASLFTNTAISTVRLCNYGTSSPGPAFNPIVLTRVTLANGQSYKFEYNVYGEIEKIIYPTGAYERFVYDEVHAVQLVSGPYDQVNRGVVDRYLSEKGDGSDERHWEYGITRGYSVSPAPFIVTTTNPDGTSTQQYLFDEDDVSTIRPYGFDDASTGRPYDERVYSSDSTPVLLSRKLTVYDTTGPLSGGFSTATRNLRPTKEISITFEPGDSNALATMVETVYDTTGSSDEAYFSSLNPKQVKKYNYVVVSASTATSASPATAAGWFSSGDLAIVAETDYSYDSNYKARNIVGLPTEMRVKDASGNVKAKTQFTYDETSYDLSSSGTMPTAASGSWVDPTGSGEFGSTIGNKRGRSTTVKSYYDITNSYYIETHSFYDEYGNVRKVRDGRGNDTETQFDDDYSFAYPTKVLTPIPDSAGTYGYNDELETTTTYDYDTGLALTVTDPNGAVTEMEYDDPLLRPTKVNAPNGAETVTEYGAGTSAATRWVKVTSDIDDTNTKYAITWIDGLGRPWLSQSEDAQGDVFSVTCYDNMGRVSKISNPFRNVSNPTCASPLEWTTPGYDDLGRTITVTTPDSAVVETAYSLATSGSQIGTVVTVEDQADKVRRSITNALGQLTRVDEPTTSGLGTISSPNQATAYAYDTLSNLTTVTQGAQTRSFSYDALLRLKEATNPESGTVKYTYDENSNVKTKWDARGIKAIYDYDRLNRVWKRCYKSVGTSSLGYTTCATASGETAEANTPDVTMYYDNITNAKGKLTTVSSSVSTTEYTGFDILGRVTSHKQTTDGNQYTTGYTYSLSGQLLEQTYPSGRVVKNTYDSADGSLSQVQSKRSSETYRNFGNGFIFNAAGAVTAMRLGNGKWENTVFNSRLQPTQIGLGNGVNSQNLLKLDYEYGATGSVNNGNVTKQTITVPGVAHAFVQTYSYDELNRLTNAEEIQNSVQQWEQTFTYDRFGNRNFNESETTTLPKNCGSSPNFEVCAADRKVVNPSVSTANNRLNTSEDYSFDSSGNTTGDAEGRTFVYDAENKQVEVTESSTTIGEYFYDGNGKRVKKIAGSEETIFVYDAGGRLIGEYSSIVQTGSNAKTVYTTNDHLGSPRINSDGTGQVISRHDYHPFGEEIARTGYGSDTIRKQFTGYERDDETGLDFAEARNYNSTLGRFTVADEAFADQYAENPQSWNLFIYVRNNPLNMVDPLGSRADCPPGKVCTYDSDGNLISEKDDDDPVVIDTSAPKCSANNPCKSDLPDSWDDWVPVWGSFRQMVWNMRCREYGGCDVGKALYHFGMTAAELTPVGWAMRGAKLAQAAPSILRSLCFEEGTPILTEDGLKPIEDVKKGDRVLSYNENTRQTEYKTVLQTSVRVAEPGSILSLKVEGEAVPFGVTGEHPFYARIHRARSHPTAKDGNDGEWVDAGNLTIGDEIRKADGTWATVEQISRRSDGAKVYNFEVADNHNYFVGQTNLLAHNNCLTAAGKRAIGNLSKHAGELVRDVQKARGGKAGAWNAIETIENGVDYSRLTLGEVANAAGEGIEAAKRVLKQVKDAPRLGQL